MAHPQKPFIGEKNLAGTFYTNRVIANFVQNFVAIATKVGKEKND